MKLAGIPWHAAPNDLYEGALTPYESTVLGYLYRRAGPDGCAWPSYNRIAADCNMSRTAAILSIKGLLAKGKIVKEQRQSTKGDAESNVYQLGHSVVRVAHQGGAPDDRGVVRQPHPKSVKIEVLTTEVSPLHPPGGESKDIGLLTAKETFLKDAREVVLAIGKHHGWLLTGSQVKKQMPFVLELFRTGIPKQFIIDQACKLDKLFTIEHLHTRIRWQDLQVHQVDPAIQEMIDSIWGGGDDDGHDRGAEVQVPSLSGQGD